MCKKKKIPFIVDRERFTSQRDVNEHVTWRGVVEFLSPSLRPLGGIASKHFSLCLNPRCGYMYSQLVSLPPVGDFI